MTSQIPAFAAFSAGAELGPFSYNRRDLRPDDVLIDILYCGICHTDLHWIRNDWGHSRYPLVPGHEIIGRVNSVGAKASRFQPGELVGIGCMTDSCRQCGPCKAGEENYCVNYYTPTYGGVDRHDGQPAYGGYAKQIVASEDFVLRLPQGLDPKTAAPLLCAGITTFMPLRRWKVEPGHKVGVIGLGGLGHMALKFARAMGAEVTLFTRNSDKEAEARRLGANQTVLSTDPAQMAALTGRLDFILDTVPNPHDLNPYVRLLGLGGAYALLGQVGPIDPPLNSIMLMLGRRMMTASAIGGIGETQEMLEFCAANGISCDVEIIRMEEINRALERLDRGAVRYRFVIDISSLQ